MGNRLVALSFAVCLATAAQAAEEGAGTAADRPALAVAAEDSPVIPPEGQGDDAQDAASAIDDGAVAPAAAPKAASATDAGAVPDAKVVAVDEGDAPAPNDSAASDEHATAPDAAPDEGMIIAPIGDEAPKDPEGDSTLLAGDFPPLDPSAPACREDTILLRGDFGKARFSVKVADDGPERAQGLMRVKSMPPSFGMLFVYPSARPANFWMKNTLIPLDMIFADQHGVVQKVHSMAIPGDLTQIHGGDNIKYVLEINGGMANMLGIKPGSQFRHPAIADPAWRCN